MRIFLVQRLYEAYLVPRRAGPRKASSPERNHRQALLSASAQAAGLPLGMPVHATTPLRIQRAPGDAEVSRRPRQSYGDLRGMARAPAGLEPATLGALAPRASTPRTEPRELPGLLWVWVARRAPDPRRRQDAN